MIVHIQRKNQLLLVKLHQHLQHIVHQFLVNRLVLLDQEHQQDLEVVQVDQQVVVEEELVYLDLGVVEDPEVDGETSSEEDIVLGEEEVGLGILEVVVDVRVEDIHGEDGGDAEVEVVDAILVEEEDQEVDGHFQNQVEEVFIVRVVDHYL